MNNDDPDSGDELTWPNALRLITEALDQVFKGAERLREMADAGYLELSDAIRSHLLYVTSLTLEHPDLEYLDSQGDTPTHYGDEALIKLIGPDGPFA